MLSDVDDGMGEAFKQSIQLQAPSWNFRVGAVPIPFLQDRTLVGTGKLADVSIPEVLETVLNIGGVSANSAVLSRLDYVHFLGYL